MEAMTNGSSRHCSNYSSLKIKENGQNFEIEGHSIKVVI